MRLGAGHASQYTLKQAGSELRSMASASERSRAAAAPGSASPSSSPASDSVAATVQAQPQPCSACHRNPNCRGSVYVTKTVNRQVCTPACGVSRLRLGEEAADSEPVAAASAPAPEECWRSVAVKSSSASLSASPRSAVALPSAASAVASDLCKASLELERQQGRHRSAG